MVETSLFHLPFDQCGTLWVLPCCCPWLYLALLSCTCLKLINHFGIIKYSKEEGIRKGQVKEFLTFSWHDSLFHICPPSSLAASAALCSGL